MSRLMSREFMDFLSDIPAEVTEISTLLGLIRQRIAPVAEAAGLGCLTIEMQTQTRKFERAQMPEKDTIYENPNGYTEALREIRYNLPDKGYALFTAAPRKGYTWTEELFQDYRMICRILCLIVGRARTMDLLNQMIHTDDLTGIGNAAAYFRFVEQRAEEGTLTDYVVNFVNIKHMKLHNNLYGDNVGNSLLGGFGRKLEALVGESGFAGRIGGDNFAAVVPAVWEWEFLNDIRQIPVTLHLETGETLEINVGSRVGYYTPRTNAEILEPLNNSSIALMRAKQDDQPDIVRFTDDMRDDLIREKAMLEAAPYALKNGGFVVYFQPKVDLDSREMIGAEALVRWLDGDQLLTPNQFIPLLEKCGFITQVDLYVFEQVCKSLKQWSASGLKPVRVSSNFSRRHLSDPEFADKIEALVRKYDVNPTLLEVEVTESYAIDNMEQLRAFQQRMHELGISVSIDDFGSGFASLSMLKKAPADVVKIDKSIIDDIGEEFDEDEIIAGHVIQMIKALDKQVVAEGVETREQVSFLQTSGCVIAQGYFFDRPMTEIQFRERLRNKSYSA